MTVRIGAQSSAAASSSSDTYKAVVDRLPRAKPALPALGAAGTATTDPVFGSRIYRVTDGATRPGALNRSFRSPSSPHQNAWSASGTYFYVASGDGTIIPFKFDASKGTAQRLQASASGDGGLVLRFYIEPEFSRVSDSLIYGSTSGISGSTLRTIDQYDFSTGLYARLLDLDTIVPGLSGTYIGGLAASDGSAIEMAHLRHAARREYAKLDKLITEAEFGQEVAR